MSDMVAGDTNRTLTITATFPTSIDVTGATAQLRWRITSVGGKPGALNTASMTSLTPSSGSTTTLAASYLFTSGQLKPGKLTAEMRVTIGGLVVTSDELLEYDVRAAL